MDDPISLDEGVQNKRRSSLPLTPAAMAAMYNEGRRGQAITDVPAVAAAFDGVNVAGTSGNGCEPLLSCSLDLPYCIA